ncbi:MAG: C40 family peptidase [Bacteroidia bacterium]
MDKAHTGMWTFLRRLIYFSLLLFISMAGSSCRSHKETVSKDPEVKESKNVRKKYAVLLNVDPDKVDNIKLYSFIDDWYGVPYKYGGKAKSGIDCSNFTCTLYANVYGRSISGTSSSLYEQCKTVSKKDLEEGDLIFFKIDSDKISHIGVYLQNNKFVHATTKKGVMIDDLDEAYYQKYYYKSGRLR